MGDLRISISGDTPYMLLLECQLEDEEFSVLTKGAAEVPAYDLEVRPPKMQDIIRIVLRYYRVSRYELVGK